MSSEKLQKAPKRSFLRWAFGENAYGEHGLKVFADALRRNYPEVKIRDIAFLVGWGALCGSVLGGLLAKHNTEDPIDSTLNREKMSILSTGPSGFAAIRTETGAQVYRLSERSAGMTLIVDPKEAREVVSGILTNFRTHESLTHLETEPVVSGGVGSGFPKPVVANIITVLLNDGDGTIIRHVERPKVQELYNPGSYFRDQMIFWGNVSADIESNRYQIPDINSLPVSRGSAIQQAMLDPTNLLAVPFALSALMLSGVFGGGGIIPILKATRKELTGSDRNGPQEPKIG